MTSHASGGSRVFFEHNGWEGRTILNLMPKRGTSALVFSCMTQVGPNEIQLFPTVSHVVYAGTSKSRSAYIEEAADGKARYLQIQGDEPEIEDVLVTARAKATSVGPLIRGAGISPIVVANDTRTDLLVKDERGYRLLNKGKPKTINEAHDTFRIMLNTSRATRKPVPYIIRTATYIHDPREPENDLQSEHDTSVWLSPSALHVLSSDSGFRKYRDEVNSRFGVDVTQISAGLAIPILLDRGHVVGLNGHPIDSLPKRKEIEAESIHTAIVGIDSKLLSARI